MKAPFTRITRSVGKRNNTLFPKCTELHTDDILYMLRILYTKI